MLPLSSDSFLEYAFVRWVLSPAALPGIVARTIGQLEVASSGRKYRLDYAIKGDARRVAIELDGFEYHGNRSAFTYDRLRQNDLAAEGWTILRFSYDAIKHDTKRCIDQVQSVLGQDPALAHFMVANPVVERPDMPTDPLFALAPSPTKVASTPAGYLDLIRSKLVLKTLRLCQREAFAALANYYAAGGQHGATVMAVGAGKTVLGVVASLAFTKRRAMIVTPGSVIRGTFDRALDHEALGNALYGLPAGPLIPGQKPPKVLVLDANQRSISAVTRDELLEADILVTNFHSLGTGLDEADLLTKLEPGDVDFIVVDEAHIAAAASYQRLFAHFDQARTLLMSACFQRLDGKPIDADVIYRYRLIDSIADGNAKNLRVNRFAPAAAETIYEMVWPDGAREEIVGREALLELIRNERKVSNVVAKSDASIRALMRVVRQRLDEQVERLAPVKPRVLFGALGERHAAQIARIAEETGISCGYLHNSMGDAQIRATRARFEKDSGDLSGIVHLKMLGQGYDFPPITIVVPVRPYGSFSEFYQFVGRGIRVIQHPALIGRVDADQQILDIVYHAEFGLDDHIDTVYRENDMDPITAHELPPSWGEPAADVEKPGTTGLDTAMHPDAFVIFEPGDISARVVHDAERIEARRVERGREAIAQRYAAYAQTSDNPVTFEQFAHLMVALSE